MRWMLLGLVAALSACSSPPGGLASPVPAERVRSISRAAAARDGEAVDELVGMLRSDDPVVRMLAIRALEDITGETLGYDHAGPERSRTEAAERWEKRLRPPESESREGEVPGT